MMNFLTSLLRDPLCDLYLIQAATYASATVAARYRHNALWICYLISAAVHIAAAVVHNGVHP
jgi:hypothetical protein